MKPIYSLLVVLLFSLAGLSQNGLYVKYITEIDASNAGEEGDMMAMMMEGSTIEMAVSAEKTWVKTEMGTMMTMEMELIIPADEMTMLMTGMMGTMAFKGNPDDLEGDENEEEADVDLELTNETKKILGYKCKKAIITNEEGNESFYWYTEKFDRPEGMDQMPNGIPGLCLQMEMLLEGGLTMIYTASEVSENAKMSDYKVEIPEGTEVKSLEEMSTMGMGGN